MAEISFMKNLQKILDTNLKMCKEVDKFFKMLG